MNETTLTRDGAKLTIERVINAPKDKVWEAYASADVFVKWFSTDGWTTRVKQFDFAPGGTVLFAMKCENESQPEWFGKETWSKSAYSVITPKDTFTYRDYFCDENGTPAPGMPSNEVHVTLVETDGGTKIISESTYESETGLEQALKMGMEEGIKQTFNKLASVVE